MHEISLARDIINMLDTQFSQVDLTHLKTIDLQIGKLSNVEPQLMINAFEAVAASKDKYQSVSLNIEVIPIEIYCEECDKTTLIENYKFACTCGKPNNNVVKGTELQIHQVHFDD